MTVIESIRRLLFCEVIPAHVGHLEIDHEAERHYFKCTRCGAELDDLGPEYHGGPQLGRGDGADEEGRIVVGRCPDCGYEVGIADDAVQFATGCPNCDGYIDWSQGVSVDERWR